MKALTILLTTLVSGALHGGTLVKPVAVTSSIAGDAGSSVDFLLDDNPVQTDASLQDAAGNTVTLETGDPLSKGLATFAFRAGSGHLESWTAPTTAGNPVFVFDLGSETRIGSILLWQYGNNGGAGTTNGGNATRDFSLIFHTADEGASFDFSTETIGFMGTMEPIYGDTTPDNPAQTFLFGQDITCRYVALRIDTNYAPPADPQITGGGDRYGLGEVRFATEGTADPGIVYPERLTLPPPPHDPVATFALANGGATRDLDIATLSFTGTDAGAFTLAGVPALPHTLAPGESLDLSLTFDRSLPGIGRPDAALEITSNDPFRPVIRINLVPFTLEPYFNNTFPPTPPGTPQGYTTVNAFPGISFTDPMWMAPYPGTNDLVLGTKPGQIFRFEHRADVSQAEVVPMLDIRAQVTVGVDMGFYQFAFHPDFGQSGALGGNWLFTCYSSNVGGRTFTVSRWEVNPVTRVVDPESETILISQYDPDPLHNGGAMFFGDDGFLYITTGDSGIPDPLDYSQRINHGLFSGVLRIDVDMDDTKSHPIRRQPGDDSASYRSFTQNYSIPNDNPFVEGAAPYTGTSPVLEEFYAIGIRSPHSMHHDPVSGRVWIGDVGNDLREELSYFTAPGANFQWGYQEGFTDGPKAKPANPLGDETLPVLDYRRNFANPQLDGVSLGGNVCVIAGPVYRGAAFPELVGKMIFGDHSNGKIWTMDYTAGQEPVVEFFCDFPAALKLGMANFCTDAAGEVFVMNLNGTNQPGGTIRKLARDSDSPEPPALLSQTGLFTDLASLAPSPGLFPYEINSPLWSDGAEKKRWLALPTDGFRDSTTEQIGYYPEGNWLFPEGSILVKHFELPDDETDPSSVVRLETRVLVCTANGGKYGVTYRWLPDQTDAVLLTDGETGEYAISVSGGGTRMQTWDFPSRSNCLQCHNGTMGQALGLRTHQINGSGSGDENQLFAFSEAGMFDQLLSANDIASALRSHSLDDTTVSLEHRVRSYLDANCAHCHNSDQTSFDARLTTPLRGQDLVNGLIKGDYLFPGQTYVVPGDTAASALHHRMLHVGNADAMPPLAKRLADNVALDAVDAWISSLNAAEFTGDPPPVRAFATGPSGIQTGDFEVTIIFDDNVDGLDISDFTITNASVATLTGSGYYYRARIHPSGSPVTVQLPAGVVVGESGATNAASELLVIDAVDGQAPFPVFVNAPLTTDGPFTLVLDFSETVIGLTLADFSITNATAANLQGSTRLYTLDLTPIAIGPVTITLPAGSVADLAGNFMAAPVSVTVLHSNSVLALEAEEGRLFGGIVAASDPDASDGLYVWHPEGTRGLLNTLDPAIRAEYQFVVPHADTYSLRARHRADSGGMDSFYVQFDDGPVALWDTSPVGTGNFAWDFISDRGGADPFTANLAAGPVKVTFYAREDGTRLDRLELISERPIPNLTGPAGKPQGEFPITIAFSEPVTGLTSADFLASGASLANLTGSGDRYTLAATPQPGARLVIVSLPADRCEDLTGKGNHPSNQLTIIPASPYEIWAATRGLVGEDALPEADPDGTGLSNLLRYAFNLAPDESHLYDPDAAPGPDGPSGLPFIEVFTTPEGRARLRIRFPRRIGAGLADTVQVSSDLVLWSSLSTTGSTNPVSTGWEIVTVEDDLDSETATRRFARVRVNLE